MIKDAEEGIRVMYPHNITELTGYRPRELQAMMQEEMRRFNSWCVHRRFGKSMMASHLCIERAINCPFRDGNYGYIAPTFDQVERIAWRYMKNYVEQFPRVKIWDSDLMIRVPTREGHWAEIGLYGVDSPKQRLRGTYFDGVVLDEWQDIPPHVWFEQVRPMLADKERAGVDQFMNENQWAVFLFTPKGRNHAYNMHQRAMLWFQGKMAKTETAEGEEARYVARNNWSGFILPNSVTGILDEAEVQDMKDNMDEATFMQEVECSFDAAIKGAIFAKALADLRERGRITEIKYSNLYPVHTGWDLGFDDSTAIWFFQHINGEVRFIDYYENSQKDYAHYADIMVKKGYRYGKNFFPHDVDVHEQATGKTRKAVLEKEFGIRVTTVPRVPKKDDAIAAAKSLLPISFFDEEACQDGVSRLSMYRRDWNPLDSVFRLQPKHDWTSHAADALMTVAMGIRLTPDANDTYGSYAEFL